MHGQPATGGVELRRPGARLERDRRQPLIEHAHTSNVRGARERGIAGSGIAMTAGRRHIPGRARPDLRRAIGKRRVDLNHGGQRLVIDPRIRGGGFGLRAGTGQHRGYRLADIANDIAGQHRVGRRIHRRAVGTLEARRRRERRNAGSGEVGAGIDRDHALSGGQCHGID